MPHVSLAEAAKFITVISRFSITTVKLTMYRVAEK
jgi:hypothetical protein